MTYIQLNLNEENQQIVNITKVMQKLKTKQAAIDYIIKSYGENMK